LGGRPRSTVNREKEGEASSSVELNVESEEVVEMNSKSSLYIAIEVEVI